MISWKFCSTKYEPLLGISEGEKKAETPGLNMTQSVNEGKFIWNYLMWLGVISITYWKLKLFISHLQSAGKGHFSTDIAAQQKWGTKCNCCSNLDYKKMFHSLIIWKQQTSELSELWLMKGNNIKFHSLFFNWHKVEYDHNLLYENLSTISLFCIVILLEL